MTADDSNSSPAAPLLLPHPFQMLVRIAKHARIGDPEGCAAVLALLTTGRALREHLESVLSDLNLSETKFAALVSLYAFDPTASTADTLAAQAGVSRSSMTESLESLRKSGWVERTTPQACIRLTDSGRTLTEKVVQPFLNAVARCSDILSIPERQTITQVCANLDQRLPSRAL